jgi:dephospho-CoA kinase
MLRIGLTGGIGSGKSAVADRFAALGAPVIDADLIARELTRPDTEALREIAEAFGPSVLDPAGALDRPALRRRVFSDPQARRRLEAILHPRIRDEMQRRAAAVRAPYVVLVVPLLLETGQTRLADRVLVVDVPEALQIERVCRRDHQPERQVRAILDAQCRRDERLAAADDVIDNSGTIEQLLAQTDRLHRRYLALASSR